MDLLKHGESAYPADAWVEQQYMKEDAFTAVSFCMTSTFQRFLGLPGGMAFNNISSPTVAAFLGSFIQ